MKVANIFIIGFLLFMTLGVFSIAFIVSNINPTFYYPPSSWETVFCVHVKLIFRNATDGLRILSNFTVEIRGPESRDLMEIVNATNGVAVSSQLYYIEETNGYPPYLFSEEYVGQKLLIRALGKEKLVSLPSCRPDSEIVEVLVFL